MKFLKALFELVFVATLGLLAPEASFAVDPDVPGYMRPKLENIEIAKLAQAGNAQILIVGIDVGDLPIRAINDLHRAEEALRSKFAREEAGSELDAQIKALSDERLKNLRDQLQQLKNEVFPSGSLGANKVVDDFPTVGEVAVSVPDWNALLELASNPRVTHIWENSMIHESGGSMRP